jgi:uncharacterized cofD-like protein
MGRKKIVEEDIKITVIGGGTGSFTLLSALKNHTRQLVALVNMADDGGSTGVLRDELGALPPGDVRQCLVALSNVPELRDLFNYRFESGSLEGHAFGNLFLTALEKMTGNFSAGVELASELLNITGRVEPVTLENITLAVKDKAGKVTKGEYKIGDMIFPTKKPDIWLEPEPEANPRAVAAIMQADMVVIAPGNLYGSIAPALIVPGVQEALKKTNAICTYVCNLVTKPGQTDGFGVMDFANEIERFVGAPFLDAVLFNTEKPREEILERYAKEGELSVEYDSDELKNTSYLAVGSPLLSGKIWQGSKADPIAASRTLIRHDSSAVAQALLDTYHLIDRT